MASYWNIHKYEQRIYTGWPGGWEVISRVEEARAWKDGVPTDKFKKVIRYDHGKMPRAATKDWKRSLSMDIRIAQSVKTKEEYKALWARIDKENWDYIIENDLRGPALINWAYNTRTADEYYRLLRYN